MSLAGTEWSGKYLEFFVTGKKYWRHIWMDNNWPASNGRPTL